MELRAVELVQAVISLTTALLYVWIANIVRARGVEADARLPNAAFVTWWTSFGAVYGVVGLYQVAAAFGYRDLAIYLAVLNTALVLLCVAFAGLLTFLLYLYTGKRSWFAPVVAYFAVFAFLLLYAVAWVEPIGFKETPFGSQMDTTRTLPRGLAVALGLAFSVPVIGAAIAYGSLYFRVHDPGPRFRIAMTAGAFLAWFGWSAVSTLLALPSRFPDSALLHYATRLLAVVVPLVIVLAYRPPSWIRDRLERREGTA